MQIKDIMHSITKISSSTTISEAAKIMDQKSIGSVLVEENNKIIGMMTERDILRKVVAKGKTPEKLKVNDIMSHPIITIDTNEDVLAATKKMDECRIRRLVVTENGKIVGMVTANSIARNLKYYLAREKTVYTRPEY